MSSISCYKKTKLEDQAVQHLAINSAQVTKCTRPHFNCHPHTIEKMPRHRMEKQEGSKLNSHDAKVEIHEREHEKVVAMKKGVRLERHSGTGHGVAEGPKKAGAGGKGTWGSWTDDVRDLRRAGEI